MRTAFVETLTELAAEDPSVILITGDLGFGVLTRFAEDFPRQYLNVGVAEQNMTGIAVGLALEGRTVFTYSIANFPTLRCLEQVRNDACYHELNVNIVAIGGGFSYGPLGMSHHATEDLSIMRALPGTTVVAPGDAWETRNATRQIAAREGVGYLRLDKTLADTEPPDDVEFELGRARRVREGTDVALISVGGILKEVLEAAGQLEEHGIAARVVSMHTLKPLDLEEVPACASETRAIVTIEENTVLGGLGGAVAEACLEGGFAPPAFARVGLRDRYSSIVGGQEFLRAHYKMAAPDIVAAARAVVDG